MNETSTYFGAGTDPISLRDWYSLAVMTAAPLRDSTRSKYKCLGNPANIKLHTRPRLDLVDSLLKLTPAPQAHGGLSAGALRRVREYVQLHLDESIDLSRLAAVAGLSMHHFAREFKQSAGVTPHHYLIQERVERAQQMLAQTDLSLAEITYAVGFSDQGHLARHFRGLLGTTPREFRRSQR